MNKLTRLVATSGATVALAIGLATPVGATPPPPPGNNPSTENNNCVGLGNCNTETNNTDKSKTFGPCSVVGNEFYQGNVNHTDQDQNNLGNGNAGGLGSDNNNASSSNDQSNSTTQSNSITIAPNCSTTNNVTNVTQAAAPTGGRGGGELAAGGLGAAQVSSTPSGGVGAGAGGAAKSPAAAIAGLSSSLGVLGLGLRISKRAFQL